MIFKWRSELRRYGLTDSIIALLMLIAIVSTFAEMVSISIFLPIFEIINPSRVGDNESQVVEYAEYFYSLIGLNLTTEVLLITAFIICLQIEYQN